MILFNSFKDEYYQARAIPSVDASLGQGLRVILHGILLMGSDKQ